MQHDLRAWRWILFRKLWSRILLLLSERVVQLHVRELSGAQP